jgi:type II secretory pathway predicted ATPase ExeA
MYEHFFGFREKPFSLIPDPAFLFLGRQHSTAYSLLEYGVLTQAGFTVITGEIGCGKTTLIRHLLNQLPERVTVGLISNTHRCFDNLLEWVLMSFGVDYKAKSAVSLYESFVDFLIVQYGSRRPTILVIDEAQNLDPVALEELRTLSNVNADKDQILQIVLVGQPELKALLNRPELRQFAQRVVGHYHLGPLAEGETESYIRHRLAHAGCNREVFTPEACRQIHCHSGGIPRLINLLCDMTLVYAYADEVEIVGADLVNAVVDDRATGIGAAIGDESGPSTAAPRARSGAGHTTQTPGTRQSVPQRQAPANAGTGKSQVLPTFSGLPGQPSDRGTPFNTMLVKKSRQLDSAGDAADRNNRPKQTDGAVRSTIEKAMDRNKPGAKRSS